MTTTYQANEVCRCGAGTTGSDYFEPVAGAEGMFRRICERCMAIQTAPPITPISSLGGFTCPRCHRRVSNLFQSSFDGYVCLTCFEAIS